jgi:hypothetical protein
LVKWSYVSLINNDTAFDDSIISNNKDPFNFIIPKYSLAPDSTLTLKVEASVPSDPEIDPVNKEI